MVTKYHSTKAVLIPSLLKIFLVVIIGLRGSYRHRGEY